MMCYTLSTVTMSCIKYIVSVLFSIVYIKKDEQIITSCFICFTWHPNSFDIRVVDFHTAIKRRKLMVGNDGSDVKPNSHSE